MEISVGEKVFRELIPFYGRVHASEQAARLGAWHQAQPLRADAAEPHAPDLGCWMLEGAAAAGADHAGLTSTITPGVAL